MNKTILTGIKPTGIPHLGNYIGAIKPSIELSKNSQNIPIYFIADSHALTGHIGAFELEEYTYKLAATWIALGLDTDKVIFYKQSDISEIFELTWILATVTSKGLMNRAHAYKSLTEQNKENNIDFDNGVYMGTYTYPILMAADILLFNSDIVPVGKDQVQHIEIARDIANSFNRLYGETFKLPNYQLNDDKDTLPGLDGRKMSKSYNNTIPIFEEPKKLEKLIKRIKTNSTLPNEPKNPNESTIFSIYKEFARPDEVEDMRQRFLNGISWGEAKEELFDKLNTSLSPARERYYELLNNRKEIDEIFEKGLIRAKEISTPLIQSLRKKVGYKNK